VVETEQEEVKIEEAAKRSGGSERRKRDGWEGGWSLYNYYN